MQKYFHSVLVTAITFLWCAVSFAGSAIGSNQGIMWGVNGHPLDDVVYTNINQQMQMLSSLGAKHYRMDFYNPSSDQYAVFSNYLAAAQSYGIVLTPVLNPGIGSSEQDSYNIAYALAMGWAKQFPQITVFELGNEANNAFDTVQGPAPGDGSSPSDYTSKSVYPRIRGMMRGLLDGMRAGNPNALGAMGDTSGCGYGFLQALWNDGLRWDITVFHPYDFSGLITDSATGNNACLQGNNIVAKHAAFGKPIWLTEFNFTPAVNDNNKNDMGPGLRDMMSQFQAVAQQYDIEEADIYELFDQPNISGSEGQFGIFDAYGNATPASDAVKAFIAGSPSAVYDYAGSSNPSPTPTPPPVSRKSVSLSPLSLAAGKRKVMSTLGLSLNMQTDGNLVLYTSSGSALWSTGTYGKSCSKCTMNFQSDGNLVLYNKNGSSFWDTGTYGNSGAVLKIYNTPPYLSIVVGKKVLWNSN